MEEIKKTAAITESELLANGWVKSKEQPVILFEKKIENRNPINCTPEDTDIKLILHCFYNEWRFAVLFPSGAMLNFISNTMDELKNFESSLDFYDCEY